MGHAKYDLPLLWGRGPFPRPVPFWFRFGTPITPASDAHLADQTVTEELHARAWSTTQTLLDELTHE